MADYLRHSKLRLFADDSIIYREVQTEADAGLLQEDLNNAIRWEQDWLMNFHPDKCKVLRVTTRTSRIEYNYSMHNHVLDSVDTAEYLGVTIQSDLKWNVHIHNAVIKGNKMLGLIRRHLWQASLKTKQLAYFTLVRPRIEYASSVWDPVNMTGLAHELEMVQRRAARFMFNDWRTTSSVTDMLNKLQWQSLETRRLHQRLIMLYKISQALVAIRREPYLTEPRRFTRSAGPGTFVRYSCSGDALNYSFFPQTVRDWYPLTPAIRNCDNLEAFKLALRTSGPMAPVKPQP